MKTKSLYAVAILVTIATALVLFVSWMIIVPSVLDLYNPIVFIIGFVASTLIVIAIIIYAVDDELRVMEFDNKS